MKTASSRHRLEQALARIADPSGEGARACLTATMIPTTPVAGEDYPTRGGGTQTVKVL
jgi:hypothetical protein